jgi:hypothetical protein
MKCFYCNEGELRSRSTKQKGNIVIRTRKCNHCKKGHKSVELPMDEYNRSIALSQAIVDLIKTNLMAPVKNGISPKKND